LLVENILDKQIVDVNGAKVVRVNDLKLGEADGTVCIIGIDVGPNGILRRIDGGTFIQKALTAFNKPIKENIIGWNFLQTMDPQLRHLTLNVAKKQLGKLHPSDLAQILTEMAPEEGTEILASVDEELAGEALHEVPDEVRDKILKEMDMEMISDILEEMPPDEAADILGDMSEEKSEELLSLMEKEDAEEVKDLLSYEEDTAGGLMTTEFLDFSPDMTIDQTMTDIRLLVPDVEFIYYIYVVDENDHLLGVVTLKKLLTSPLFKTLKEVMTQNVKSVHFDTGRKGIAEMISKYDIIALPVIDDDNKILGIITVDDIIDLLVPNPTRRRKKR
jgi:Mg/Co/Ni transporter MgtE